MSFFFIKNKPSLSFVFDIRDTSISLAAVRFQEDKKPEIVLCQNFEMRFVDSRNHKRYTSSMISTIDKAIVSVRRGLIKIGNHEKIDKYYFFMGSPWSVSQAKTIKIIKDKIFEINNNILAKILVGEEAVIERKIEAQTKELDWKILEEKIVQSKLNGYKVDDIFGKKTTNLAIELFVSFIPSEIKSKLSFYMDEKLGKNTKRQNNSCILSSYSFFRDLYSNKNDFIYVDLGKLITDVYVVRDDVIFGVASFPYGEENIIQHSLLKSNLSRDILMSHLSVGIDKKFDLTSHNNGEDLLRHGFDIWNKNLRDSLSKICTEMNIPNILFIIETSTISKVLAKDLLNKSKTKEFKLLNSSIEVVPTVEGVMNNFILNGKTFANEPYIKMDLVYLDKILKQ